MRVIYFIEWATGAVSLTVIGTILSLKDLSSYSQVVVMIILYAFLISTVIKTWVEAREYNKTHSKQDKPKSL